MKKLSLFGLFLLLSVGVFSQTSTKGSSKSTYKEQWVQVERFDKDDLPKSATTVVDEILKQAIKDKNMPQTIKALIYKNKYAINIGEQENTLLFADLEDLAASTTDKSDKALLHSMLAELYQNFYNTYRWNIDQRTDLVGYVPADIQEWSKNIFKQKALENLAVSVEDRASLLKTPTTVYNDIIEQGEDSRRLYPTLYDFLMNRAIVQSNIILSPPDKESLLRKSLTQMGLQVSDLAVDASDFVKLDFKDDSNLTTLRYYKAFLESLLNRNMNESLVLTQLNLIEYLSSNSQIYSSQYAYNCLSDLQKKNQSHDYNVEVIAALVDNVTHSRSGLQMYGSDLSNDDSNNKKAYDWCKLGLAKYPNYKRIDLLKARLATLEVPFAQVNGAAIYHPDTKNKTFKLDYRNLKEMTIKVVDANTKSMVKTEKIQLAPKATYTTEKQEFTIDLNRPGNYDVSVDFDKKKDQAGTLFSFSISPIASFTRVAGKNQYEFYVVDRLSGKPLKDATIHIYSVVWASTRQNYTQVDELKTDAQGLAHYDMTKLQANENSKESRSYQYRIAKDGVELPNYEYFASTSTYTPQLKTENITIFTDRSIYRPGQTVYYKAISTQQIDKNTTGLNANKQYKVSLYDTNNQLITDKKVSTNEFGSLAGEFVLPQGKLSGSYRIEVGESSQYFSVEEYKRPTFEVTFDKIDKAYSFGDVVKLTGHANNYSGAKVQGGNVEYSITKTPYLRWWFMRNTPENIDNGMVETKDDGSFEITFTLPPSDSQGGKYNAIYDFIVNVDVTDLNGETQSGNCNITVGDVSMTLSANIPAQLNKDTKDRIQVTATNLNGRVLQTKGSYTVYSLLPNDSIKSNVSSGSFSTDTTAFDLRREIVKLPSAKYRLSLNAKDDKNREVVSQTDFVLYSFNDQKPPIETNEWMTQKTTTFSTKQDAEIILGVSSDKVTILYDLLKGDQLLAREHLELSNENRKLIIPYKKEYEKGITAVFTYVVNEKAYIKQIALTQIEENPKTLNLKWEVFRNKLRPGQQEEWRISIKDNQNKPALAELLASMYDSSLDQLNSPNGWTFYPYYREYIYPKVFGSNSSFASINGYSSFNTPHNRPNDFAFDQFNWFGFNFYERNIRIRGRGIAAKSSHVDLVTGRADLLFESSAAPQNDVSEVAASFAGVAELREKADKGSEAKPQIRQNFNETAFFYPQLKTDKNGETIISFVVPESNTTWSFRALAYDKAMNIGSLNASIVTSKELMVTPNMPRFVRQGDKTSISTKVSNLSDKAVSGKVRIEFFDPSTEQASTIAVSNRVQDFSIDKGASQSVTWTFDVPADLDMLGCRIVAESESFSDGEQHAIPVLSNRMLVTESMTMNINGTQTKEFAFERLKNNPSTTLSNYRLTLEYTANPAWYAIQALPVLSNPTNENAVNWFASYYVNTLGSFIMKQYPRVATMIDNWKKQGADKQTLLSQLQKNEELKTVLLEETPWVLDAKDETEQMNRLSLLFDLNNTTMQTRQATEKLQELQNPDGGWSWYKGMHSSRNMTQYILYGFAQLVNLNAVEYPNEVRQMQMNALRFIDTQILEDYNNLKRHNKDWAKITRISTNQLEYLYVRSNYRDIPIDQETRQAERFYTSVVEKNWVNLSLYERSLLAVLSVRNGNTQVSNKIMQSIREHATTNDEMGMFWANNTSTAFMSNSAVTVHTFVMEAFKEAKASPADMDLMKQWLLKQKQTQVWESTHATIDAIYALLSTGSDWFASAGESKVYVGNQLVDAKNKELGTGYIKQSWGANEMTPNKGNVRIEKSGNGPAWGAMYWQYYENLDKITVQKGELAIDKKLFVEKNATTGKTLLEVTPNNPLQVGDKVVMRLTVRVDRDMEFVHLKDMRASCFEPSETLSGIKWANNTYYYQSTKDASTNFYFDHLSKGTYVFEYPVYVTRSGQYSNGITTIQCMYAPQFVSHTNGIQVTVK